MDARQSLHTIFGFDSFRPGQDEAVTAALNDRDSLVVMPTGAGKSLCYQLPALMRDDLTLVVSPLVSLMQDQVQALGDVAPGRVELVNAQRRGALNAQAVERAVRGEVRVLYVAPERFGAPGFEAAVSRARVGLFVVDEAHCVSQWGHDFRPDYFTLASAAKRLAARATIALTATATPQVADDIVRRLALRDPVRVTTGFDRPNLSFAVVPCGGALDKGRRIAAALGAPDALPAIVYAGTRDASEQMAQLLTRALGEEVVVYHAGLDRRVRADDAGAVHDRRRPRDRRHQRVRDGHRQGRRSYGLSRIGPGIARGLLPGGRPGRPRRSPVAVPAVRRAARQGAARVLHPACSSVGGRTSRRSPSGCAGPGSTDATTCRCPSWPASSDGDRTRTRYGR